MNAKSIQMIKRKLGTAGWYMGVLASAVLLTACESNSSKVDDNTEAKTATVNFEFSIPEAEASKALIPSYTASIGIRYCRYTTIVNEFGSYESCEVSVEPTILTADKRSHSLSLVPGKYRFESALFNGTELLDEQIFDVASTEGEIIEGANAVKMSFLQGTWTFRTADGTADPIILGSGKTFTGIKLRSFGPYGDSQTSDEPATASKSAFNIDLPVGYAPYHSLVTIDGVDDFAGYFEVVSQFHSGNVNNSDLWGIDYNVSKGCSFFDSGCRELEQIGDWFLALLGADDGEYDDWDNYGPYALLPADEEFTLENGDPLIFNPDTTVIDGSTLRLDFVEGQGGSRQTTVINTTAASTASLGREPIPATAPRSRAAALKESLAEQGASKSVDSTLLGTITVKWYDWAIIASGDGSNRGTWNFDRYEWDEATGTYSILITDGCFIDDAKTIAECGWLQSEWDSVTGQSSADPGEFSNGFQPADPSNLGSYGGCYAELEGFYEPWCFDDYNNMGSFYFTQYIEQSETMNNVRIMGVNAKGVSFPEEFAIDPPL